MKVTADHELDIGATENKVPDKDWLLSVLATFKPDHVFFSKDYLPPQRIIKREEMVIDNSDNFFSGLPKLSK